MLIAIIGGIGAGKSTLLAEYKRQGKDVIDADDVNKILLEDTNYISLIKKYFPSAIINDKVDKKVLKSIIFNDEEKRLLLNHLSHKSIMQRILAFSANKDDVFVEMPVFDGDLKKYFKKVIFVECNYEIRKQRVIIRDNIDESLFDLINKAQFNEDELRQLATEFYTNG